MGSESKKITHSVFSESASSTSVDFLTLPVGIRNKIYKRVLFVPHPLYLFQEPGSHVESFMPEKPVGWLAILYTNRKIYREASAVLYEKNRFHLVDITEQQFGLLQSFLECIGPVNAASLSHLCINFPVVESACGPSGNINPRLDSLETLKLVRDKCTNLSTLEMLVHHKNRDVFRKTDNFLLEALSLVDSQFKTIPSLEKVIVRFTVHDGVPSSTTRKLMQELGWVVVSGDGN